MITQPDYVHRACKGCGKRIPRWTDGKETPKSKVFCGRSCASFWRRMHPKSVRGEDGKVGTEHRKKVPVNRPFLEPFWAVEDGPKYAPCKTCGYTALVAAGELTYCSDRCRSYVPKKYKPWGKLHVVAGPVDYCEACGFPVIESAPRVRDGKTYCRDCAVSQLNKPSRRKRAKVEAA